MTATRLLIVGGGPAGANAGAATLGAQVMLVKDSVVGGAAHLWDCVRSKAMVASAMRLHAIHGASRLGVPGFGDAMPDMSLLSERADRLSQEIAAHETAMLASQGVEVAMGRAKLTGANQAVVGAVDAVVSPLMVYPSLTEALVEAAE